MHRPALDLLKFSALRADNRAMTTFRPLRTLGATLAAVAGLLILCFSIQDLWTYQRSLAETTWATSGEGWWQLTWGISEAVTTIGLFIIGGRLLGPKYAQSAAGLSDPT